MELKELTIYVLARKISSFAWKFYSDMDWQTKKIMGDQWITSIDSIGANIAEGFGRYHYLDKNRFNLNARGSLLEAVHWTELIEERGKMSVSDSKILKGLFDDLYPKLNKYISSTKELSKK